MQSLQTSSESASEPDANHTAILRRDWLLFSISVFLFGYGFGVYSVVFLNYITDMLGVAPVQMGVLESSREIPGLLAVGIAGLVASFAENRVGAGSLIFSALGVAATGYVHTFPELVAVTVFWSVFMHQWFTTSSAIPLALSGGTRGGRHLGRMASIGAAATILAYASVHVLVHHVSYRGFFLIAGSMILLAGLLLTPMSHLGTTKNRQRLLYRREYRLYYLLTFLEGFRRQVFTTFAIFALVQAHHTPLDQISSLMIVNASVTFLIGAPMGRIVDRVGERNAMAVYYAAIALAFLGYAVTSDPGTMKVLYVLDNALFTLGVSITTYLNRIVRDNELMPSLAMGQTMNHIAAVAIPVCGGLLWYRFGYHAPFWAGVIAAAISLVVTRFVPKKLVPVT